MLLSLILLAQFFMTAQEQVSSAGVAPVEVLEVEVLMREVKGTRVRDPRHTPTRSLPLPVLTVSKKDFPTFEAKLGSN